MASTNHTANYNLSQFLGTDKPAWLGDYNSDMTKIDAGIAAAASTATGADGKADANTTKIGTLSNLTTTAKTDLVSAINELDTDTGTAQNTANTALSTANGAKTTADGVAAYLAMTNYGDVAAADITISAGSITQKGMHYASNAAGTLGKLYGYIFGASITGACTITISNLPFNVTNEFSVQGIVYAQATNDKTLYSPSVTFKTNNTATLSFPAGYAGLTLNLYFSACILFIQNFGDQAD